MSQQRPPENFVPQAPQYGLTYMHENRYTPVAWHNLKKSLLEPWPKPNRMSAILNKLCHFGEICAIPSAVNSARTVTCTQVCYTSKCASTSCDTTHYFSLSKVLPWRQYKPKSAPPLYLIGPYLIVPQKAPNLACKPGLAINLIFHGLH